MKILIAEDNPSIQQMSESFMESWGFDFDMASNGEEAVNYAKVNEGEYDLCLMDIDMPVMDGLEATKIIRRELKYFPILALSGNAMGPTEALAAGVDAFIRKPCSMNVIYKKIIELTTRSNQSKEEDNRLKSRTELVTKKME